MNETLTRPPGDTVAAVGLGMLVSASLGMIFAPLPPVGVALATVVGVSVTVGAYHYASSGVDA